MAADALTEEELDGLFKSAAQDYAKVRDSRHKVAKLFPFPNVAPGEDRGARRAQLEGYVPE